MSGACHAARTAENNTADKKDIFYIIVLILTFITVIVGATFALYAFIFSQKEGTSAVYTGTLSIEYLSGNIIKVNDKYGDIILEYTYIRNTLCHTPVALHGVRGIKKKHIMNMGLRVSILKNYHYQPEWSLI